MKNNKTPLIASVAIVIIIVLIGVIVYLIVDKNNTQNQSNSSSDNGMEVSIEEQQVIATVPTQQREISLELMAPQRTGDTLVFNYNLVNTSEDSGYNITDRRVGVYTENSGTDSSLGGTVREAFATASDGQRYGIVTDENGDPLVTGKIDMPLLPGEKTGGVHHGQLATIWFNN